jgi:glycosyltransferase involved in cell wall biosynthesis
MKPLISVIIPCYNVENYIDRCLDSLVNQTIGLEHLELILINDASTDHTLEKLQEWERRYPDSIALITYDENLRQGGARNIGLQYAQADYVGFVDSDDWVELDMYETLYSVLERETYDVVRGKFIRDKGTDTVLPDDLGREDQEYHFSKRGAFYDYNMANVGKNGKFGGIVTGIYRKAMIVDSGVSFPEKTAYEDNYWGSILKLYVKSTYIVDKIVYHYFVNQNSTVLSRNAIHQLDRLPIEISILEEYQRLGAFELFYRELEVEFIQRFYLNTLFIIFTRFDNIPDVVNDMREVVLRYFPNYKDNPYIEVSAPMQQLLMDLLEREGKLSQTDLYIVKCQYLEMVKIFLHK